MIFANSYAQISPIGTHCEVSNMATFRGPIRLLAAKEIGSFDVPTVGPIIDKPDNSPADHTVTIAVVTVLLSILLIVGVVVGVKYVRLRRSSRSRIPDAEDEQGDDEISLQFALQDLQPPTHNDSGGTRVVITPGSSGSSRVSPLHGKLLLFFFSPPVFYFLLPSSWATKY